MKTKIKKYIAILLGITLLGISLNSKQSPAPLTQTANAATTMVQLKHNAYVYTKRGVRKHGKSLKKGQVFTTHGTINIKGKKYYCLSKARYIKSTNVSAISNQGKANNGFQITLTKPAMIFNSKFVSTGKLISAGTQKVAYGTTKIKGYLFYKLGNNQYILASTAKSSGTTTNTEKDKTSDSTDKIDTWLSDRSDKPTPKEVRSLLANSNDKLGYAVYFSDSQLAQVKNHLWEKIQSYRIEKGYPAYKSNPELDTFIKKVSSKSANMIIYADDINGADLEKHLPSLASKGMNAIRAVDNYKYYGNYLGAPAIFNIKDRNPEHVATEIFESLKNDNFYDETILGKDDKLSYGSLGLNYYWDGRSSCVGLVFIEVTGSSQEWIDYYNQN
ncbi:hypothetical protein F5ESL0263_01625 [Lactobacillus sp. ESL0263]|uniref:SLAP domain-containing protein n=1 Tax=Lactobacillus sp. ESL0263 TaxID=2069350 RepID=UPI000EFC90DA|nr:SLAP domain-containing protein [Lactobacillus sp. ESL0263]RMC51041.1 hypothetical protein F5ESL0263_01625 [Lactobacillus sp. ESL0263]